MGGRPRGHGGFHHRTVPGGILMGDLADSMLQQFDAQRRGKAPSRNEVYKLVGDTAEQLADLIGDLQKRLEVVEANGARFRGVYQRATSYKRGDQATHKGSLWTALMTVPEGTIPGESPAHWQLAAKGTG